MFSASAYLVNENSREVRLMRIAGALRRWVVKRPEIKQNLAKSSRSCTRFTTEAMSALLPDAPEALSGWNTPNHYFYEIVNRDGESVRIQLSFSAHNIPDTLRDQCERIDALTHSDPHPHWLAVARDVQDLLCPRGRPHRRSRALRRAGWVLGRGEEI